MISQNHWEICRIYLGINVETEDNILCRFHTVSNNRLNFGVMIAVLMCLFVPVFKLKIGFFMVFLNFFIA